MGDRNATAFAQGAHVQLLRNSGLMVPEQTIAYRRPWPRGKVAQGVMIDDQVTAAKTPRAQPHAGDAAREARRVFEGTLKAYGGVGLPDVPKSGRSTWQRRSSGVAKFEAEQAELEELARGAVQCRRSLSASRVAER